jgi:hypothetical protein
LGSDFINESTTGKPFLSKLVIISQISTYYRYHNSARS